MQRWLPLYAILVLLLALGLLYGPALYRNYLFQRDVEAMLAAARAGNTKGIAAAVQPADQAGAESVLTQYLPADYAQRIAKLTLASSEEAGGARYAIVTCRLESGDGTAIYQGRLRWVWNGKRWDWDFFGSYAAPYTGPGQANWIKLDDLLPEASGQ